MLKSIQFLSLRQAEKLAGRPDVIVVSVRDRHQRPNLCGGFGDVLPLSFDDYDEQRDGLDALQEPFSTSQAETLKRWLVPYVGAREAFTLVVHCHAGISRSAAIAWWAHQTYGAELATRFPAGYLNRHVLRILDPAMAPPPLPADAAPMPHGRDFERDLPPPGLRLLVVFAHGKESGPWGSKIRHLAHVAQGLGAQVLSPDYSDLASPDQRVERLLAQSLPSHDLLVLAGSSMGGYVSTLASRTLTPDGLFLMAPAFYMPGYAEQAPSPGTKAVCLVHGWNDEVIPVDHGIRFAQACSAELHVVDGGHRLNTLVPQLGRLFRSFLCRLLAEKGQRA